MSVKNELLKMIDERYHKFSKGQKKLADFIREDYDKAAFLTAAKMGGEVGVRVCGDGRCGGLGGWALMDGKKM